MRETGWIGEDQGPAMPVTAMMLDRQQHRAGPLETALARSRAAHEAFREATRAAWEAAQSGTARQGPRPFESGSRGAGRSTEHTGPDCRVCAAARERDAARAREDAVAVYGEIAR